MLLHDLILEFIIPKIRIIDIESLDTIEPIGNRGGFLKKLGSLSETKILVRQIVFVKNPPKSLATLIF